MFDEKEFYEKVRIVDTGNYCMRLQEMDAIYYQSGGVFDAIVAAFNFGFLKGQRQAKAQARKKAAKTA